MFTFFKALIDSIKRSFIRWPREVKERMAPIVRLLREKDYRKVETEIAYISLDICEEIESKVMKPREADLYFTYLLDIMELSTVPLNKDVKALILEGNVLHDFDKKYGADLKRMKDLANSILSEGTKQ